MGKTIVAYFTATGSTKEAAQEMGRALAEKGRAVEVLEASALASLDGCDALILGAPINGMQWIPEATAWARLRSKDLGRISHAYFALSAMIGACRPFWQKRLPALLDGIQKETGALATAIFPGRLAGPTPPILRFIFGLPKDLPLDRMDVQAMRTWALEMDAKLR